MPAITIYPSRFKLVRGFVAGIVLTLLFVAIMIYHQQWKVDTQWWLIAYPGVIVAGLATLYWLWRLFAHKPALRVTREGIIDTSSVVGVGLVRWDEITRIGMRASKQQGGTNTYLTITPRDLNAVLARQKSRLTKLYDGLGNDAHTIEVGQVMLPVRIPQLLTQIEAFYHANVAPMAVSPIDFVHAMQVNEEKD